jgi:hypothetical protein
MSSLPAQAASPNLPASRVGIYRHPASDWPADLPAQLQKRLSAGACQATILDEQAISDPERLGHEKLDLLILCDARTFPSSAVPALDEFVHSGGKVMALGGPALQNLQWRQGDRWLGRQAYLDIATRDLASAPILDLANSDLSAWTRATNNPDSPSKIQLVVEDKQPTLQVDLVNYDGWDGFKTPPLAQPIPASHQLTCFRAKGSAGARQLLVEWTEADGLRWIAIVPLTTGWRDYVLTPDDFRCWDPERQFKGRGGPQDHLRMDNVRHIAFGLARSHCSLVEQGDHSMWVTNLHTAAMPAGAINSPWLFAPERVPALELLCPDYKVYPVTNLHHLAANPVKTIASTNSLPTPASTLAPHPRPQGSGFNKNRAQRFIPLVECRDAQDRACGAVVSLMIQGKQAGQGGMTFAMPVTDAAFFSQSAVQQWLVSTAGRMLDGVFLYEGGAAFNASFGGESMPVGAVVCNRGGRPAEVKVLAEVHNVANNQVAWQKEFAVTVAPGEVQTVESAWNVPAPDAAGPFTVTVNLQRDGQVIDRLQHEVRIWSPNPHPEYLATRDGDFYFGDRPWRMHGINYHPTSSTGAEDYAYYQHWMDARFYDPDTVERNLSDIQSLGLNAISLQLYDHGVASRNILDVLMRCQEHGLKVNLAFMPAMDRDNLRFDWNAVRNMLEGARLAENDTIVAYDLAWEPNWGKYAKRCVHDAAWANWVEKRYGDVAAAEKAWDFAAPMRNGKLTGPQDKQMESDGAWTAMVIDYRRFLNDLLQDRYGEARRLVRSIDPNHLVSFRMDRAGDPNKYPWPPYDLAGAAKAVDILEPEGYGYSRTGGWSNIRWGIFTVAYGRAVAPQLPIIWAEFGYDCWNPELFCSDPKRIAAAGQMYDDFYRMVQESGSNGSMAWWLSGGYRVLERSDYGVLNPDRTWRPAAKAMHNWAPILTAPRKLGPAESVVRLPIHLDSHVDGFLGIVREVQAPFWQAIGAGKTPVLTTQPSENR